MVRTNKPGKGEVLDRMSIPMRYNDLMSHRVREILLVSSPYDFFILEEDGQLTERILSEYVELNLRYSPKVTHAADADDAIEILGKQKFQLIVVMMRVGQTDLRNFHERVRQIAPGIPMCLMTYDNPTEQRLVLTHLQKIMDFTFVWSGDPALMVALVKAVEDRANVDRDIEVGNVRVIVVLEDSIRYYSNFLPIMYQELVKQTQLVIQEEYNDKFKLYRMRTRPKLLLAHCLDEAEELIARYGRNVMGIVSDISVPRTLGGEEIRRGGFEFIEKVRKKFKNVPIIIQSSDPMDLDEARRLKAGFIDKNSPKLFESVRTFMRTNLGFGEFVFRRPNGTEVGRVSDIVSMEKMLLTVDESSIAYHASHDHFSTWFFARGHFALAEELKRWSVEDFETDQEMRVFLVSMIGKARRAHSYGVIATFSREKFDPARGFVKMGSGSLGGKARGIAFLANLLGRGVIPERIAGVAVRIPDTLVASTDIFDVCLEAHDLGRFKETSMTDEEIDSYFSGLTLPQQFSRDLEAVVKAFHGRPVAVRSSSLFEDSYDMPFAGLYRTIMLPNCSACLKECHRQLNLAIKLVYASVYHSAARAYRRNAPQVTGSEKMGVVIQELIGNHHGEYFYPDIAGVGQSDNYYPFGYMKREDGISVICLGLGKSIVDGEKAMRFSPRHPRNLPQFSSTSDFLKNTQKKFYALKMDPDWKPGTGMYEPMLKLDIADSEAHGTLDFVGGVYSAADDRIYPGINREGTRLVTFDKILKFGSFPLCEILSEILGICRRNLNSPVEIEFAVRLSRASRTGGIFYLLQVRPQASVESDAEISIDAVDPSSCMITSTMALGNRVMDDVRDILFVKPETFASTITREIVPEIDQLNRRLAAENRPSIIMGFGRWGTSDHFLGIPVKWDNISTAKVIIEAGLPGFEIEPSQGTHFFQNITSFRIVYITVHSRKGTIDWDWLRSIKPHAETKHLVHLRFDEPVVVMADGRTNKGVLLYPGASSRKE